VLNDNAHRRSSFPLIPFLAVHDLRDIKPEKQPTLDINGFTWTKSASKLAYEDFGNDEIVRERYYPEVADMLRQQTGSRYAEIVILDHEVGWSSRCSRCSN